MICRRQILAPALAALLAACAVGPDYQRPPVETPAAFKEIAGWKPVEPKLPAAGAPVWSVYGDKVLDDLIRQVDVSNQNLKASEAAYRQAVAIVGENRASFFPTLNIDGSAVRSGTHGAATTGGTTASRSTGLRVSNQFAVSGQAAWVPDIWGQVRRQVEGATATAQADAAQIAAARLSAQATLAEDYFALRILDEQKRLFDDTVAAYLRQLHITENKYRAGNVGRSDLEQARAQYENARSQDVALGVARAQNEHAIAVLIGKPPAAFALSPAPLDFHVPVVPVGLPSTLLERNPTVASAERQMAAANAQIGVAVAGYFPTITLGASYGFTSNALSTLISTASSAWSFGLTSLSAPIFNGFLTHYQVEAARAAYDQTVATYRQTVLTAFQGVEDNIAALRILQDQAEIQGRATRAAAEAERLILNQYKAGTVDYTSVVTAQATSLGDQQTSLTIMQSRLNASVLLIENLGGNWSNADLPDASLPVPPPADPPPEEVKP